MRQSAQLSLEAPAGVGRSEGVDTFRLQNSRAIFLTRSHAVTKWDEAAEWGLIQILELMSLSQSSGKNRRGRISYAQWGVNQLGEVYGAVESFGIFCGGGFV